MLSLPSSSTYLHMSVFCRHFYPRQTPLNFSVYLLSLLLYGPPTTIISLSPQHLYIPSISATSAISYPYTPLTPSLSIALLYISIYLSISSHSISISSISYSLSIFLYSSSMSYSPGFLLTFSLSIIELSIISLYYYLSLTPALYLTLSAF